MSSITHFIPYCPFSPPSPLSILMMMMTAPTVAPSLGLTVAASATQSLHVSPPYNVNPSGACPVGVHGTLSAGQRGLSLDGVLSWDLSAGNH